MFRRNQMEIIIAVLVFGVVFWWFFVREEKKPLVEDTPSAPYKVPEPEQTTPSLVVAEEPVVVEKEPAKPKPAARTAKPKAPAKATVKAKAPAKPRATKTKPQA